MDCRKIELSYFNAPITNKVPSRTVTLAEVAQIIRSSRLGLQTQKLRTIRQKDEARLYKGCNFPYATISGVFSYCSDACLVKHSRLLCIDLDGVEDVDALKQRLIADGHFFTVLAFRSPSGQDVVPRCEKLSAGQLQRQPDSQDGRLTMPERVARLLPLL